MFPRPIWLCNMIRCQNNINKVRVKDKRKLAKKNAEFVKMHFWLYSGQEEQEELDPWLQRDGAMLA